MGVVQRAQEVEREAEVHALAAAGYPAFVANMEEPYDAHGDSSSGKYDAPARYLAHLDYGGELGLTTTPLFGSDQSAWIGTGAIVMPQAFSLETGVGFTSCVEHCEAWGWPLAQIRPLVQSYPTRGERPDAAALNHEATELGLGGIPYTIEQACDPAGLAWLEELRPTIERPQPKHEAPVTDTPHWSETGYPGGPMVAVKGFPRPMYPPDAAAKGKKPSKDGPDVVAYKRTVSRAGRWTWQKFDDTFSDNFAHGKDELADSGVAGVQRQQGIDATGWIGEKTFNTLRSIRVPDGLPNAGEPAMDATAVNLINDAWDIYGGDPGGGGNPRDKAMSHLEKRVGYTEHRRTRTATRAGRDPHRAGPHRRRRHMAALRALVRLLVLLRARGRRRREDRLAPRVGRPDRGLRPEGERSATGAGRPTARR